VPRVLEHVAQAIVRVVRVEDDVELPALSTATIATSASAP
jgi:hypothetical protein